MKSIANTTKCWNATQLSMVHFGLDEENPAINWILILGDPYKMQQLENKFPDWCPLHTMPIHKTNTLA